MKKLFAALHLFVIFVWAIFTSGIDTLRIILRHGLGRPLPPARFVQLPFAPMSELGASLLASMITLTPGTTAIDIDMDNHLMLLHVLDATDVQAVIDSTRHTFEPDLITLFGEQA